MTNEPNATEPMSDAEGCKMLGEFVGLRCQERIYGKTTHYYMYAILDGEDRNVLDNREFGSKEKAWLATRFHSRDALWTVLLEFRKYADMVELFSVNLSRIVSGKSYIKKLWFDTLLFATPRQLFEAAVETVEEMKGVKP